MKVAHEVSPDIMADQMLGCRIGRSLARPFGRNGRRSSVGSSAVCLSMGDFIAGLCGGMHDIVCSLHFAILTALRWLLIIAEVERLPVWAYTDF